MAAISVLLVLSLSALCSSQTLSSSSTAASAAASSSSSAAVVTVTSVSTLAIVIVPSSSTPYSYSSTSTVSSTLTPTPTITSTSLALPTVPYTGQALLVGTCEIPEYTAIPFPDGSMLEVPLVGCSDERPDCCPSLNTWSVTQPATTNIVSLLNQAPLNICPKDFTEISRVCCPSGYRLYGQGIVGQTPCYAMLSTSMSVPQTVLASISSAVAATISAKSTTAAVSVIINQVFALSLPCGPYADNTSTSTGLSTGAKAGIGAGAGAGGLILITLAIWFCVVRPKKRQNKAANTQPPPETSGPRYSELPVSTHKQYPPAFSPGTSHSGYTIPPMQASPPSHHQSFEPQNSWPSTAQPTSQSEHMSGSSDSARQYGSSSPGLLPGYVPYRPGYMTEMPAYLAQTQRHEMPES